MKWLVGVVVLVLALVGWLVSRAPESSPVARPPARSALPAAQPPPAAERPRGVRTVRSADERRQLVDRIAAANARRARDAAAETTVTPGAPSLPPTSAMATTEQVLKELQAHFPEVRTHVSGCIARFAPELPAFKASLVLVGDADVGTLIDASGLATVDGAPVDAKLDDCVRGALQTLVLPPIAIDEEFKVSLVFSFDE